MDERKFIMLQKDAAAATGMRPGGAQGEKNYATRRHPDAL
jgi:hypothetical protein